MSDQVQNAYIDNPLAPDVFADSVSGMYLIGGLLRITLEGWHSDYATAPHSVNRVCIGRVILSTKVAELMAAEILEILAPHRLQPTSPQPVETKVTMN